MNSNLEAHRKTEPEEIVPLLDNESISKNSYVSAKIPQKDETLHPFFSHFMSQEGQEASNLVLSNLTEEQVEQLKMLSALTSEDLENISNTLLRQQVPEPQHGEASTPTLHDNLLEQELFPDNNSSALGSDPSSSQAKADSLTETETSEDQTQDTKTPNTKVTPPPISEELKRKLEFERTTYNEIKTTGLLAAAGLILPPTALPTALIASLVVYSDIKKRYERNPDAGISSHFLGLLKDTKDTFLGQNAIPTDGAAVDETPSTPSEEKSPLAPFKIPPASTPLTIAITNGDVDFVNNYFKGKTKAEIAEVFAGEEEQYALHYAAAYEKAEMCKCLIKLGAPTNIEIGGKTADKVTKNQIVISTIKAFSLLRDELDILVGMEKIKRNIYQLANKIILDKRRAMQSKEKVHIENGRHMILTGNPGTGKTKVAEIIANLYYALGVTKKNVFNCVQRGDLCAEYIGQTAPKTRKCIQKSAGGVLFVDEAYRLSQVDFGKDYGLEAIEEIMQHMTVQGPNKTIFIFAGYREPMEKFINSNPGIFRRVDFQMHLSDYCCDELAKISSLMIKKANYSLAPDIDEKRIAQLLYNHTDDLFRSKMNGGLSEKFVQYAIQIQNESLSLDVPDEELYVIRYEHLETAIKLLLHGGDIHALEMAMERESETSTPANDNSTPSVNNEPETMISDNTPKKMDFDDLIEDLLD